ncbi:condensation domain-containing protein [Nocardiopsis rhodophaea]|uniref:Condensation domain-containing protein n=1 Tax=Nocardiopsis rhodophaea TaxID=280238 RepID=A0ABN2S9N9_9ACTN
MLMTRMVEYSPEPGELVEFEVQDTAGSEWTEHPEPPSWVQQHHTGLWLANQAAGRTTSPWVCIAFDLPGRLDTDAMAAALETWARRHSTLLTWFAADDSGLKRYAMPPESLAIRPVSQGEVESSTEIRTHLRERLDTSVNPMQWPPFAVTAVLRDTTSTLVYAVDHSHCDGLSLMLVFAELRALYQAELDGTDPGLPEVGSYVDFCAVERERLAQIGPDTPGVDRWLEFWQEGGDQAVPLDLGTEPGKTYPSLIIEEDVLTAVESDVFSQVCKASGGGSTAGLLAALAICGYELNGSSSYRGLTVVNTRDETRWFGAQGWFINVVPITFPVAGRKAFSEVIGEAQRAFREARAMAGVPLPRVAELYPDLAAQFVPGAAPPMVSYLDLRHAPASADWPAANLRIMAPPGETREVSMWLNRAWDRTFLNTKYPDTEVARTNVPIFLERLHHVLQEVARNGDYSISDRDAAAAPADRVV